MNNQSTSIDRSIHFLIPSLSAGIIINWKGWEFSFSFLWFSDEPSHILSLPETFAIQQSPLEVKHEW